MKRTRLWIALGIVLLAVAGTAIYFRSSPSLEVDVAEARKGPIEEIVTAVSAGTVKSRWEATVSAETAGKVVQVLAAEGTFVRKGEVLARLSDTELPRQIDAANAEVSQAVEALRQAEKRREEASRKFSSDSARAAANLRKAKEEHRRASELFLGGFLSRSDMDQADTQSANAEEDSRLAAIGEVTVAAIDREIGSLKAREEAARAHAGVLSERLGKMAVVSPFPGVVTKKSAEVGETKSPGSPMFVVADPREIHVEAPIDESESAKIRIGQEVRLYPDAYLGEVFKGEVFEIKPTVEVSKEVSRANTIKIRPLSPPKPLRLGMSVDVEVVAGRKQDVVVIPSSAVMERDGKKFVYIVLKGEIVRKDVTTGVSNWEKTEVLSGVAPGDAVVTTLEAPNLKAGSRVGIRARK